MGRAVIARSKDRIVSAGLDMDVVVIKMYCNNINLCKGVLAKFRCQRRKQISLVSGSVKSRL